MINVIILTAALFPAEYNESRVTVDRQTFDKNQIALELRQQLTGSLATMAEQMSTNIITAKQNFALQLAEQNTIKLEQRAVFVTAE